MRRRAGWLALALAGPLSWAGCSVLPPRRRLHQRLFPRHLRKDPGRLRRGFAGAGARGRLVRGHPADDRPRLPGSAAPADDLGEGPPSLSAGQDEDLAAHLGEPLRPHLPQSGRGIGPQHPRRRHRRRLQRPGPFLYRRPGRRGESNRGQRPAPRLRASSKAPGISCWPRSSRSTSTTGCGRSMRTCARRGRRPGGGGTGPGRRRRRRPGAPVLGQGRAGRRGTGRGLPRGRGPGPPPSGIAPGPGRRARGRRPRLSQLRSGRADGAAGRGAPARGPRSRLAEPGRGQDGRGRSPGGGAGLGPGEEQLDGIFPRLPRAGEILRLPEQRIRRPFDRRVLLPPHLRPGRPAPQDQGRRDRAGRQAGRDRDRRPQDHGRGPGRGRRRRGGAPQVGLGPPVAGEDGAGRKAGPVPHRERPGLGPGLRSAEDRRLGSRNPMAAIPSSISSGRLSGSVSRKGGCSSFRCASGSSTPRWPSRNNHEQTGPQSERISGPPRMDPGRPDPGSGRLRLRRKARGPGGDPGSRTPPPPHPDG